MRVKPWGGMNVTHHWGGFEVAGKVVLDIGADYGTTADYFLAGRAKLVVAVESNDLFAQQLTLLAGERPGLVALHRHVTSKEDFRELFQLYAPDVVKVDCEGCECALLELDDEEFSQPALYAIETHGPEQAKRDGNPFPFGDANALYVAFVQKFHQCGYEVVRDIQHNGGRIVYAKRRTDQVSHTG
jgi:hypothetical protein